jgi:hypothetical protein
MSYTHIGQQFLVGTAVGLEPNFATQYMIDSRAMRKVPVGYGMGVIVANSSAVNAFNITLGFRFISSVTGR